MTTVIGIFENQYLNRKSLTVVKPGTQKRDFTHIDDIVKGCYNDKCHDLEIFWSSLSSCPIGLECGTS